jgi:hypothetical protein
MNANDPNAAMLERVAEHLGDALRQDMVFVGGAVAGLLITDPAMPAIRPTEDVDLIFEALAVHLPGDAASQERLPDFEAKLRRIAGLLSL